MDPPPPTPSFDSSRTTSLHTGCFCKNCGNDIKVTAQIQCWRGPSCKFLRIGCCRFFHGQGDRDAAQQQDYEAARSMEAQDVTAKRHARQLDKLVTSQLVQAEKLTEMLNQVGHILQTQMQHTKAVGDGAGVAQDGSLAGLDLREDRPTAATCAHETAEPTLKHGKNNRGGAQVRKHIDTFLFTIIGIAMAVTMSSLLSSSRATTSGWHRKQQDEQHNVNKELAHPGEPSPAPQQGQQGGYGKPAGIFQTSGQTTTPQHPSEATALPGDAIETPPGLQVPHDTDDAKAAEGRTYTVKPDNGEDLITSVAQRTGDSPRAERSGEPPRDAPCTPLTGRDGAGHGDGDTTALHSRPTRASYSSKSNISSSQEKQQLQQIPTIQETTSQGSNSSESVISVRQQQQLQQPLPELADTPTERTKEPTSQGSNSSENVIDARQQRQRQHPLQVLAPMTGTPTQRGHETITLGSNSSENVSAASLLLDAASPDSATIRGEGEHAIPGVPAQLPQSQRRQVDEVEGLKISARLAGINPKKLKAAQRRQGVRKLLGSSRNAYARRPLEVLLAIPRSELEALSAHDLGEVWDIASRSLDYVFDTTQQ